MHALITNDDGVASDGIRVLAQVAAEAGLDVLVAAPARDLSGASASLTATLDDDGRFVVSERSWDNPRMAGVLAVEAAPAFIVRAAMTGAFGPPPEVVLSGINHGPNTGHAVLHSGTVGAALTASTHGRPALAVSIATGTPTHWETAREVAGCALAWLLDQVQPLVVNVNVPNVPLEQLRGFEPARLAAFGAVQATVSEKGHGYVKLAYEDVRPELEPGTDAALVAAGAASFTVLQAVCEASRTDTGTLAGGHTVPALANGSPGQGGARLR